VLTVMWKIGVGYLLLLLWCYARAEVHRQHTLRPAGPAGTPPSGHMNPSLRIASWILLLAALVLVTWGSGWNVIFWLPAGVILAGLVQTLLPLRNDWR
jgi:hypothetical protein